jgi:predicted neuraminidase
MAVLIMVPCAGTWAQEPMHQAQLVFPLHDQHNHAPGIAELPDGGLLVSWYRGSGERSADDVAVYGSLRAPEGGEWSDAFVMVDTPGFPDCNTCLMCDGDNQVWLFWPVILANSWESCITHYRVYDFEGFDPFESPVAHGSILLKPADFSAEALELLDKELGLLEYVLTDELQAELEQLRERLADKLYQRLGWQPRCKPTVLASGRILLPLYSDTYSFSIMAISDDGGQTWYASEPLMGFGNIQPAVLQRRDGTLVAYMRENGPRNLVRVCESTDDGLTWGEVGVSELPNPGSGLDGVVLASGRWLLVYNDTIDGRNSLAVSLSDDEGRTWPHTRHLELHETGSYHYPAVIQSQRDDTIHCVYSYFVDEGKSMKHAAFNEAWVLEGE